MKIINSIFFKVNFHLNSVQKQIWCTYSVVSYQKNVNNIKTNGNLCYTIVILG